jgi:HAD superfamily hydrolase (TIGR01509 family)
MTIKAVLFDCDGLMFNTERIAQKMWMEEAGKYGESFSDAFFKAITGAHAADLSAFRKETPHLDEIHQAVHEKRFDLDFWASFYPDGLNKPGLIRLVLWLQAEKIPYAVCSSSSKGYVETLLHTVSVPLHFETVIGGDMVTHSKPDPEIFLKGAEALQLQQSDCLVLEDSKQGILAAHNAGMHNCFIQDTIEPDTEMRAVMEHECRDLNEVIGLIETLREEENI